VQRRYRTLSDRPHRDWKEPLSGDDRHGLQIPAHEPNIMVWIGSLKSTQTGAERAERL
jgi:hypothetical protein